MDIIIFLVTLPFTIGVFVMKYGLSLTFWFLLGSYVWSLLQEIPFQRIRDWYDDRYDDASSSIVQRFKKRGQK